MMEKMIKVFYIVMIALVVFLGGLLICKGMEESAFFKMIENQEGTAL